MSQPAEALSVWHWFDEKCEYIVAALGASDAALAFERVAACRGKTPLAYPESRKATGRDLATKHPGVIYRRTRSRPTSG